MLFPRIIAFPSYFRLFLLLFYEYAPLNYNMFALLLWFLIYVFIDLLNLMCLFLYLLRGNLCFVVRLLNFPMVISVFIELCHLRGFGTYNAY